MANLREKAVLVSLKTRQFTGVKTDTRIKDAAVAKHGVKDGAIRGGQKVLLGDVGTAKLEPVQAAYGAASRLHIARTLPWLDAGPRILGSGAFQDYMGAIRTCKDAVDSALASFLPWYELEYGLGLPTARQDLNGLFEASDYPSPAAMARRFVLTPVVQPFPDAEDFRVDLGAGELARVRVELEASITTAIDAAMGEVWERIRDCVGHLSERLHAYDPSGAKVAGKFHDTLTLGLRELTALLPGLNVTGDPRVAGIADSMAGIVAMLPEQGDTPKKDAAAAELRDNGKMRAEIAAEADAILTKMAAFV